MKRLIVEAQSLIILGAFLLPMVCPLHSSVKAPPTKDLAPPLNGVWNSLLFMMCNNGSERHKVCSYCVIKTICVFPKQEEARWEGGEEKKEQQQKNPRTGSVGPAWWAGSWDSSSCHIKNQENVLWIQSLLNILHVHFPRYLPIYTDFQMLAFLRTVEIFAFKIRIVSFLETKKNQKKLFHPHLQKFFTETKEAFTAIYSGKKKKTSKKIKIK